MKIFMGFNTTFVTVLSESELFKREIPDGFNTTFVTVLCMLRMIQSACILCFNTTFVTVLLKSSLSATAGSNVSIQLLLLFYYAV